MNTVTALLVSTKHDHAFDVSGNYLGETYHRSSGEFTFKPVSDFDAEAFKAKSINWQIYIIRDGQVVAHQDITGMYSEAAAYASLGVTRYSGTDEELQERTNNMVMEAAERIEKVIINPIEAHTVKIDVRYPEDEE